MDELYKEYGMLMIEAEIIQSKIQAIKQQIADGINTGLKAKAEVKQEGETENGER